jgi:hypothetical protein
MQTAHDATRPLDRPTTEYPTCATIPDPLHQISYSCHDPHRCTSCYACHLYTTRQANVILKRNKNKRKTKRNYPEFKFKHRQVNDSSQSNQETDHFVSQVQTFEKKIDKFTKFFACHDPQYCEFKLTHLYSKI